MTKSLVRVYLCKLTDEVVDQGIRDEDGLIEGAIARVPKYRHSEVMRFLFRHWLRSFDEAGGYNGSTPALPRVVKG